ncbi:hypothetical protein [Candidatus Enterovibrio altilux]|uniref:hypothetical protein n=1 Tax=Candidatus Enterovibrio altilux TaxID=1927128 RepID=UPI00137482C5
MKCYLTCSNRPFIEFMKYQLMMLMIRDKVTKPFGLNELLHLFHQEKEQFLWKEIIRVI